MSRVFTNGCFDLLHRGHIRLLEFAASLGDELIVGINSDASVRKLKGPGRPVVPCEDRVAMLQSIRWVDRVYVFDEETPEGLIAELQPDVLIKGPGIDPGRIPGADLVTRRGGIVVVPDWQIKHSTTKLIKELRCKSAQCGRA